MSFAAPADGPGRQVRRTDPAKRQQRAFRQEETRRQLELAQMYRGVWAPRRDPSELYFAEAGDMCRKHHWARYLYPDDLDYSKVPVVDNGGKAMMLNDIMIQYFRLGDKFDLHGNSFLPDACMVLTSGHVMSYEDLKLMDDTLTYVPPDTSRFKFDEHEKEVSRYLRRHGQARTHFEQLRTFPLALTMPDGLAEVHAKNHRDNEILQQYEQVYLNWM